MDAPLGFFAASQVAVNVYAFLMLGVQLGHLVFREVVIVIQGGHHVVLVPLVIYYLIAVNLLQLVPQRQLQAVEVELYATGGHYLISVIRILMMAVITSVIRQELLGVLLPDLDVQEAVVLEVEVSLPHLLRQTVCRNVKAYNIQAEDVDLQAVAVKFHLEAEAQILTPA